MANESLVMTAEVRDQFSGVLRKLQNDLKSLSNTGATSTKNLQKDWKGVGAEIQSASGSITRDMLPAMRAGNLAGLALGGTIGAVALGLKNFAQNTMTLGNFSKEIGLASREVAKLQAMGGFFGIDESTTQANFRTFQTFLQAMERNSGETLHHLRSVFGKAGDDIAAQLLKPGNFKEKMEIAFTAIRNVDSEPTARKLAEELFGNPVWAQVIRNMTPELQAAFGRIATKIDENKDAATRFNVALLEWKITVQNLTESAFGPLLRVTTELMDKWKLPIENKFKQFADDIGVALAALEKLASGQYLEGLKQIGEILWKAHPLSKLFPFDGPRTETPGSASITRGMNAQFGVPGSPTKDIPKTNDELRQTNEKLKTATEKQTSVFEKIIDSFAQGTEAGGLGPGMGGAGALAPFRAAMAAGGGGPSIRHGAATGGGSVANAAKFGQVAPRLMDRLMKEHGLTREQAAGVVGNLGHESGGFKHAEELAPNKFGTRGLGWAQWTDTPGSPRRTMFENWAKERGLDPRSDEASERYLFEGDPQFRQGLEAVKRQSTTQGSMQAFEGSFERAGVKAYGSRLAYANRALAAGSGAPPADLSNLRVKPGATGGGEAAAGVVDLSRYAQSNIPGFNRVTAINDRFHQFRRRSAHNRGLATDFTIDDPRRSAAAAQQLRDHLAATGLDPSDYKVLDEYKKLSAGGTAGHLHVQFNTPDAAERYRKATLLQQQSKAEKAQQSKLEANGTVNIHLNDGLRDKNAKVDTDGMFKDVNVNRGRAMSTAEDNPVGRAHAGF